MNKTFKIFIFTITAILFALMLVGCNKTPNIEDIVQFEDNKTKITGIIKTDITEIEIPYGVTEITEDAFNGCMSLKRVVIPDSVQIISARAFWHCTNIEELTAPCSAIPTIPQNSLKTVIITNGKKINDKAFEDCVSLESISLPNCLTSIGNSAFSGCNSLVNINFSDNIEKVGAKAFEGTAWYSNQPNGLLYVGKALYKYKGVVPIGEYIQIKEGTKSISQNAFPFDCGLTKLLIPNSVTEMYANSIDGRINLVDVSIPANFIYNIPRSNFLENVTLTDGETIPDNAFNNCTGLSNIVLPNSITSIGKNAFNNCNNLTNIILPDGIKSIDSRAFGNSGLRSIVLPKGITSVANYAFYLCTNLTNVIIPNGVSQIGNYAFTGCTKLKSITIPESITRLGVCAFDNCVELESIYFGGTREQWMNISKAMAWKNNSGRFTVICRNGSIGYEEA